MSKKILAVAAIALLSLLMVTAAVAAAPDGSSAGMALPVPSGSATLAAGGSVWYGFQYAGDGSQIQVILNDNGQGGLGFSVYTPDEITLGQSAIGGGSPNADVPADEFWTGNFPEAGIYYVNVTSSNTTPTGFTLMVTGSGVSGLPGAAPAAPAAAAAPAANPAPAPVADGSSASMALAVPSAATTLNAGASVWYMFGYAGDGSQIQVILNDNGQGLTFDVYTPQEIQLGQSAVGSGSPNSDVPADEFWTGSFPQAGTYFVNVNNPTSNPIGFTLMVTGSGVQ